MRNVAESRSLSAPAVVALLVVVVGCGGGGGGGPVPTPAPSETPATTTTPHGTPTPAPTPTPTTTVRPNPFPIVTAIAAEANPAVGYGDGRYLTTFSMIDVNSRRDLFGVRLARDGAAIDADPVLLSDLGSNSYLDPNQVSYGAGAIGFDGEGFGVFFYGVGTVPQVGPPGEIIGFTSVPTDGPPLQPATEVDTQASFSMAQTSLSPPTAATSDGTRFAVVYPRNFSLVGSFSLRQVDGAFVTVTGGTVDPQDSFVIAGALSPPVEVVANTGIAGVANNGSATVAAWLQALQNVQTPAPSVTSLEAALIAPDEVTLIHLSDATTNSGVTKVASDGVGFLIVWSETTAASSTTLTEIRAIRYVPGGSGHDTVIAPSGGFVVASGAAEKTLGAVAFAAGTYLVAWLEDGAIRGARIAEDGTTPAPFTIETGPVNDFALASDGERFLFVIEKPNQTRADVLGLFVDANE